MVQKYELPIADRETISSDGDPHGDGRRSRVIVGYNIDRDEGATVQIECLFFGPFREDVGEKTVFHETTADTVGELLSELETEFPALEGRLVNDAGTGLAGRTVVTKDTKNVTHLEGLETPLEEDAVVRLVPSVYGG